MQHEVPWARGPVERLRVLLLGSHRAKAFRSGWRCRAEVRVLLFPQGWWSC